ncbi:MAG TPA: response regulator [Methylomirabilota bacterium]|nr:response regulator [Methylomirabilota bacterium]
MSRRPRQASPDGTRYLTTRESAERLGVTINAIKAWIREKRLPALRTPGGHHRITERDLMAFQAELVESCQNAARSRILVVDDDAPLAEILKESLQDEMPDAQIRTATDGYEALVQVGAFRPDVLALDIRMPRLDGFEVCRRLKARRDTAGIRILAMTAYSEGEVKRKIIACGAEDFIEKPFSITDFRAHILTLLGKAASR